MRKLAIIGAVIVVVLAVAVYRAKLGAEETQGEIDLLTAEASAIGKDIAVMKAEEAYLTRPERIAPIARQQLGLEQAQPDQYTASEALSRRLGEERLTLPAPAPAEDASPTSAPLKSNEVKPQQ
ncbi:MAG: cell division protein FtsL [Hyphomonadaceae bacterium]|nr:cell division protein FtsL [Hyphomonadaceae bacterium]